MSRPAKIPAEMQGIAGQDLPFLLKMNIEERPIREPNITNNAGVREWARRKTPAVIIGKMTSPPPRIAK